MTKMIASVVILAGAMMLTGMAAVGWGTTAYALDNDTSTDTCANETDLGTDSSGQHWVGCCGSGAHGAGTIDSFSCSCDPGNVPTGHGSSCDAPPISSPPGNPGGPPGGGGLPGGPPVTAPPPQCQAHLIPQVMEHIVQGKPVLVVPSMNRLMAWLNAALKSNLTSTKDSSCVKGCNECAIEEENARDTVVQMESNCVQGWAYPLAAAKCDAGLTRMGDDAGLRKLVAELGRGISINIGGQIFTELWPHYQDCIDQWIQGYTSWSSTDTGTSAGQLGGGVKIAVPGLGEVTYQGQDTETVANGRTTNIGAGRGLFNACQDFFKPEEDAALKNYNECTKKAPDAQPNGICTQIPRVPVPPHSPFPNSN